MDESIYRKTLARAVRLLAAKPRSRAQLAERLAEKADPGIVEKVVNRLEEVGYLDDERFATSFVTSRVATRPLGPARVRQDLYRRKVSDEVANRAIAEVYQEEGEEALVDRAIAKRIRLRGIPETREETHKLFAHLIRQGFGFDLVMRKIRALSKADNSAEHD